jgi:uncharacterized protein (TIGR03435 family)
MPQEDVMHVWVILLLLAAPLAMAQGAVPAPTVAVGDPCSAVRQAAIDVATVKPSERSSGSSTFRGRPDSLIAGGTVLSMIEYAWNLRDFQVAGGAGWIHTATWEVTAKVDEPPADWSNLRGEERDRIGQQRMQAVLAQRFALRCHFETKELPVYNLVVAKGGAKLKPTPSDAKTKGSLDLNGRNRENRVEGKGVTMEPVAVMLTQSLGRTVIDKTGLSGLFDFTLAFTSDPDADSPANDGPSGPSIFTALEEQLGLRLEPAKGPVPVLLVDSIARPSEN